MKKFIVLVVAAMILLSSATVFALIGEKKGASKSALERIGDESIIDRVSDWFATRGKTEKEKKAILTERKAKRTMKKTEKLAAKKKKEMEKQMKRTKNDLKGERDG